MGSARRIQVCRRAGRSCLGVRTGGEHALASAPHAGMRAGPSFSPSQSSLAMPSSSISSHPSAPQKAMARTSIRRCRFVRSTWGSLSTATRVTIPGRGNGQLLSCQAYQSCQSRCCHHRGALALRTPKIPVDTVRVPWYNPDDSVGAGSCRPGCHLVARSSNWLGHRPLKAELTGSSPVRATISFVPLCSRPSTAAGPTPGSRNGGAFGEN